MNHQSPIKDQKRIENHRSLNQQLTAVQSKDTLIVVVKKDCPTCNLVVPVLQQLRAAEPSLTIYTQDDPAFPETLGPVDDTSLEQSYRFGIQIVPTLIRVEAGACSAGHEASREGPCLNARLPRNGR